MLITDNILHYISIFNQFRSNIGSNGFELAVDLLKSQQFPWALPLEAIKGLTSTQTPQLERTRSATSGRFTRIQINFTTRSV